MKLSILRRQLSFFVISTVGLFCSISSFSFVEGADGVVVVHNLVEAEVHFANMAPPMMAPRISRIGGTYWLNYEIIGVDPDPADWWWELLNVGAVPAMLNWEDPLA